MVLNMRVPTMTPRELFESLPEPERAHGSRDGRIKIADLLAVVKHHQMRSILVSTENFGLVSLDKAAVLRRLNDSYFQKRIEKIESEKQVVVEASIFIDRIDNVKHEAYRISIHTIGAWNGDGKIYMVY